jgi:hypothetical protein
MEAEPICQVSSMILDGDGNWDELFTMVDLNAGESKTYSLITMKKEEAPEFLKRVPISILPIKTILKNYLHLPRG